MARLAFRVASPVLAALLAASGAGVVVASAAPSAPAHGHGHGHGNGNQAVTGVGELGRPDRGVMGRIASAVAELEADDSGQAPTAAVLALAQSISPSALAPGHLSRLLALNAVQSPTELPATGAATTSSSSPSVATSGAARSTRSRARAATTGSVPAAGGTQAPALPSVVIAPPSTLPSPPTFVPSPSGGASTVFVAAAIAVAVALAALVAVRFMRRPG